MNFSSVFYEPDALHYNLGKQLKEQYKELPWFPIESHNRIEEMQQKPNSEFADMKRNLIIGIRKTHRYVENEKISDFLVPYTSSGCSAMCLYCYLVCNYNKCSYLRLFVNREQMLERLIKTANKSDTSKVFEIGSNSDLVLENTITGNLEWTIKNFMEAQKGSITFPTKFEMIEPLLNLNHEGRVIFRMSVNPPSIINHVEFGTSRLIQRIRAVNDMCEAGYPTGILIAPVILVDNWKQEYRELISILAEMLTEKAKKQLSIEIIFMTYSFVHRAINKDAFPHAPDLYDTAQMTGRGRGKYCYRLPIRTEAETFLKAEIEHKLGPNKIVYIC